MSIDRSDNVLTVTFRRRWEDKFTAFLCALVVIEAPYLVWRIEVSPQQSVLLCDRGNDTCSLSGHDVFGGGWTFSYPASQMRRSRVVPDKYGQKWIVDMAGEPTVNFGNPTGRTAQQEEYAKYSAALQAFIEDRAQRHFEARFASIGGLGVVPWILVELLFGFVLFRYVHGWRTRLIIDRTAGQLTVQRTPALWPPARQVFPLADIERVEGRKGWMVLRFVYFPTYTFCLIGHHGRVFFSRTVIAGKKAVAEFNADIDAINNFRRLGARRSLPLGG